MTTRQAAGIEPSGLQPPRLGQKVEVSAKVAGKSHVVVFDPAEGGDSSRFIRAEVSGDGIRIVGFSHDPDGEVAPNADLIKLLNTPPVWDEDEGVPPVARCPSKRRIGTFSITKDVIEDQCPSVMAALDGCVVVRCELNYGTNCFEYTALHDDFDEVPPGCAAIAYIPVLHVDHPNGLAAGPVYRRTWEKRTP